MHDQPVRADQLREGEPFLYVDDPLVNNRHRVLIAGHSFTAGSFHATYRESGAPRIIPYLAKVRRVEQ